MAHGPTLEHSTSLLPVQSVFVTVVDGPDAGKVPDVVREIITIGAASDNTLVLTDETVSRYHLELRNVGSRIVAHDLGSRNGTVVGKVMIERAQVAPGVSLRLGRTTIRVDGGRPVDAEISDGDRVGPIVGRSPRMRRTLAEVARVAGSALSVVLLGESGVGKEVIAQTIHEQSERAGGPFEVVDCGAIHPHLIASELFGHERGAFTGADRPHKGAFERAHRGTLFLDEIGELDVGLQASLLGALERRVVRRVGGSATIDTDVRVVCATNRDLREAVNDGTFRQDLYYRIAGFVLQIPALRERREDVPFLVDRFLEEAGLGDQRERIFGVAEMKRLERYRWPGNVRELRNYVEATIALGVSPPIHLGTDSSVDWPESLLDASFKDARRGVLELFVPMYLRHLLERCDENVSKAARESGIHRSYLNELLKKHELR